MTHRAPAFVCDPRFSELCSDPRLRQIAFEAVEGKTTKAVFELPVGAPPASVGQLDAYLREVAKLGHPEAVLPTDILSAISSQGTRLWEDPQRRWILHGELLGGPVPEGGFVRLTVRFP